MSEFFNIFSRHSFLDDHYVEFSKLSQDRVIGTKEHVAHVSVWHSVNSNEYSNCVKSYKITITFPSARYTTSRQAKKRSH